MLKSPENRWRILAVAVPLIFFSALIRLKFTFGDGPELLTAAYNLCGPHPSGYPLFTLLGFIPSHLPWLTPFYNMAWTLSALPTALTAGLIFMIVRRFQVREPVALLGAWAWAFSHGVVYLATRIEVYALHCMLLAGALLAMVRFAQDKRFKDAWIAVLCVCLGLTNHLTSALMILPVILTLILVDKKQILTVKAAGVFSGIAAACAAIYLYLPLQAMMNTGQCVSWNDPQTLERFIFHVTGQEYSIFRNTSKLASNLNKFALSIDRSFMPGMLLVAILGVWEMAMKSWKVLAGIALFMVLYLAYIGTYSINDISTYYTMAYVPIVVLATLGFEWFLKVRFLDTPKQQSLALVMIMVGFGWLVGLGYRAYPNTYREAIAQDMSTQVMNDIEGPALIFTSVDGHSFPMWYQAFVAQPNKGVIPVDAVMFGLKNKAWYREWFRRSFPQVNWPPDDVAVGGPWQKYLLDNNPNMNMYVMLNSPWRIPGYQAVSHGWHFKIEKGTSDKAQKNNAHIYSATGKNWGNTTYFLNSELEYKAKDDRIACVAEWRRNNAMVGEWTFYGPNGKTVTFKPHPLPAKTDMSWEWLEIADQEPGEWRCEVKADGQPTTETHFTLK